MKKILFTLIGLFGLMLTSEASHFAGGDLQYRYIGDSTGVANQYQFILRLYRDMSGINMPNTVTLYLCSSCYATQTITLPQVGPAQLAPTLFDCVDQGAPGTVNMQVYEYRNIGTLPGSCADYKFVTAALNARNGAIDNLSSINNLTIQAKLNNMLGNNSSPKFVSEPVRAFCVGKTFNWKQSAIESDGDSLRFSLFNPKGAFGGTTCAPADYGFNGGWSWNQPIRTVPGTQLVMNPKTGVISFTPSMVEVDVLAVAIEEYRFDTIYFQWVKIGEATRDMQITVSPACSPIAQQGVILNYNAPGFYEDPVSGLPTVDYTCLDSAVVLKFATKLDCSSISPDGTDFRLTAPNGQPIPVKALVATCDANNETLEMIVKLHKPLAFNGNYYLYSKMGNDGTTLLNKCGFPMAEFDTIQLRVTGCFTTDIDMRNVTIVDDEYPRVQWYLDTVGASAPFPKYLVDEYKVLRSDDHGANYKLIYTIKDYKNMTFNDKSLGTQDVDADYYKYKVDVVVNSFTVNATRNIHSILLETQDGLPIWEPADTVDLKWNAYNGWPSPEYTVFLGTKDGSGNWVETIHGPVGSIANPGFDTTYRMINSPGLKPGDYRVCVRADYPGGSGPYEAWSNCIPFNISQPIIPPVVVDTPVAIVIPNIITPNGDGTNDLFEIENIQTWTTTRSVQIFNRWGSPVFETGAYENSQAWSGKDMSGKNLADGVYMYVIEVYDQPSGKKQNFNGHVTIMGSTN